MWIGHNKEIPKSIATTTQYRENALLSQDVESGEMSIFF